MEKMKYVIATALASLLFFSGCGNLSPRLENEIDNQGGEIEELKQNQNSIVTELGKLRQEASVISENLDNFQQGLVNLNAKLSHNENSGVQILQGDGALIMVFGLGVILILTTFHYRNRAQKSEKVSSLLADAIADQDDLDLEDAIFYQAINDNIEKDVYNVVLKSQTKRGICR